MIDHEYSETVYPPDCYNIGYSHFVCIYCADEYDANYVSSPGHDYGDWTVVISPTCTDYGKEVRTCNRCGVQEEYLIAKLDHTYTESVTPPTCTDQGYTTYKLARINEQLVIKNRRAKRIWTTIAVILIGAVLLQLIIIGSTILFRIDVNSGTTRVEEWSYTIED